MNELRSWFIFLLVWCVAFDAPLNAEEMLRPPTLLRGQIGYSDYPPAALRAGMEGETFAGFTVGADGRVSNCHIRASSGHPLLDVHSCALITSRYVFEPARDATGQAVAVHLAQRINWLLMDDAPVEAAPAAEAVPPGSRF